jgi:hypothetical protein
MTIFQRVTHSGEMGELGSFTFKEGGKGGRLSFGSLCGNLSRRFMDLVIAVIAKKIKLLLYRPSS